jgi:hypothetical protein
MALSKNALELAPRDEWFKSSYSNEGNNCIEVAKLADSVGVRDSKQDNGPAFTLSPAAFVSFIAGVNEGDFKS